MALETGISPSQLLEGPDTVVDSMIRQILHRNREATERRDERDRTRRHRDAVKAGSV